MEEKNGCEFCLPAFFHSSSMHEGRHEETDNATVTFVKYQQRIYAVTCHHVVKQLDKKRKELNDGWQTLTLHLERVILQLSAIDPKNPKKRQDIFRTLRTDFSGEQVDIVIGPITDFHWELIESKKHKSPVDLDNWIEPRWDEYKYGSAFGYPTDHKEHQGKYVSAPCLHVTAEVVSRLGARETKITLFSELDEPHGFFFSGMSGGIIILQHEEFYDVAGIVYEGQPGGKNQENMQNDGEQVFSEKSILIKGFIITPEIFSSWLVESGLKNA
ncbi:hypothetical protein [endosymbiont of unidentified scaly snail isolate Monju]|uniref:hypothetical protein n=1 Tax=endosymbiont of unidentified scaly snail isolate Monju TaxID=1248727 RepID=UPI0011DD105F|nr:hypothetical protein [endosymbiont of unidentified scaly snail isolate Monju]